MIDQVDLVAHDSYRKLLEQKDALIQRIVPTGESAATGEPLDPNAESRNATAEQLHRSSSMVLREPCGW